MTALSSTRMGNRTLLLTGIAATLAAGALWHGPLGAGPRLAARMEARTQQLLVDWDMQQVRGTMAQAPMRREMVLAGPADDFQRSELKRLVALLPGVEAVSFDDEPRENPLPLVVQAELAALVGFGIGLIIAYLGELRRRSRQWDRF